MVKYSIGKSQRYLLNCCDSMLKGEKSAKKSARAYFKRRQGSIAWKWPATKLYENSKLHEKCCPPNSLRGILCIYWILCDLGIAARTGVLKAEDWHFEKEVFEVCQICFLKRRKEIMSENAKNMPLALNWAGSALEFHERRTKLLRDRSHRTGIPKSWRLVRQKVPHVTKNSWNCMPLL